MKSYFTSHPYAKAGLLAIPLIILAILMENYFPEIKPEGFPNFIVAFEFAKSLEDLNHLFSLIQPVEIKNIDAGNYIDFGYMIVYSLFLLLFFRKTYKIHSFRFLLAGIPLSIVIFAADFYENILLLKITTIYAEKEIIVELQHVLNQLQITTWIKWGGIAIAFFLLFFVFIRKRILSKIAAVFCLLPLILGILFWISPQFSIANFTLSVLGAFAVLFVYSFTFKLE